MKIAQVNDPGACARPTSGVRFYARILSYFREDRGLIAVLIGLIWISLCAGALEPVAVAVVTDAVLSGKGGGNRYTGWLLRAMPAGRTGQVVGLAVVWVGLRLVSDVCTLLREMINNQLKYNGTARVRWELFDHLQRLSPAYHRSRPQGDALYRLNTDSQGLFGVLNTFIGAANSALTLFVIGAVMLGWNVRITVVALCLAPVLVIANAHFGRTIRKTSLMSKQADQDLMTFTQRAMSSVMLVQLFGRQVSESGRFRQAVDHTIRAGMRMNWQEQLYPLSQRLVYAVGYGFILAYGGYLVLRDRAAGVANPFTVGGVVAMTIYLAQLWEPLRRITGFTADVQNNAAAAARVFYVLDLEPTVGDTPGARPLDLRPRTLELVGVHFGYEHDRPVLRGVEARIEPGEMVAFVGPSGTGKSTLLNLLPRFYDPDRGAITLDGQALRDVRLADVRRHVALVPQDSPVVAGTVSENIAFGRPGASAGEIAEAARLAGADAFIEELPLEYQTEVTEGGQNLSGGQRQRLAIARALLSEAPILVLDEPTSGLDAHHEHKVLETLRRLRGRRTIVLVTHSLDAAAACERIFVLHGGRVAEEGSHDELLERGGVYARMVGEAGGAVAKPSEPDRVHGR